MCICIFTYTRTHTHTYTSSCKTFRWCLKQNHRPTHLFHGQITHRLGPHPTYFSHLQSMDHVQFRCRYGFSWCPRGRCSSELGVFSDTTWPRGNKTWRDQEELGRRWGPWGCAQMWPDCFHIHSCTTQVGILVGLAVGSCPQSSFLLASYWKNESAFDMVSYVFVPLEYTCMIAVDV